MNEIKAIETEYNGYKFRSRLEARWAVFFDELGIEYEYEPEGFEFEDGTKYLPDFYLPKSETYVEVKGIRDGYKQELEKAVKFVDQSWKRVILLTDIPYSSDKEWYPWFPIFFKNGLSDSVNLTRITFNNFDCIKGEGVVILDYGVSNVFLNFAMSNCEFNFQERFKDEMLKCVDEKFMYRLQPLLHIARGEKDYYDDEIFYPFCQIDMYSSQMKNALLKARQARFEHGETPRRGA